MLRGPKRTCNRNKARNSVAYVSFDSATSEIPLEERRKLILEETKNFISSDLQSAFSTGEVTAARYSEDIKFEDPITSYTNRDAYMFNIRMLKTLFNLTWKVHSIQITGPEEITTRWSMGLELWQLPWKPSVMITGKTFYKVNPDTGIISEHVDTWDALDNNRFFSLEAVQYILRSFLKEYETRYYPSYLVAELQQPAGSGPASGSGFNELAQYIFGGNREQMKLEMTTPVLSTIAPGAGNQSTNIQFVMEGRFSDVTQLPTPVDPKVLKKAECGGYFAAISFPGWPLDFEVVENERLLRDSLLRDGLKPKPGYTLARYNDPTTPPMLRRNEVLIEVLDYQWPPSE
ncbi:hypothetical protein CEUSTIGMA_g9177.t1 [Chlamydomonas eustigma]|uniref:SOUL heme-binding protein n=1 Tax=Chlamydomonas eustigma TaxID=1157962 RepID=A0A250XFR1_9CHLO|nr:hypothetical protein CEUSTIGMA_g9177.t1 [Chlamydomonas eustigma]|eukprot:GAX81749.1 hypothetical protein CEUSTIGMA_g9177.t1 [Chlamydomonas eustigma]